MVTAFLFFPLTPSQAANYTYRFYSGGPGSLLLRGVRPQNDEDPTERALSVTAMQMCPERLLLYVGEEYKLAPLPFDSKGYVVHGAALSWASGNKAIADIAGDGNVIALQAGTCTVTATAGTTTSTAMVEVRSGSRPSLTNEQWDAEHSADCTGPQGPPNVVDPPEPTGNPGAAKALNATGHPRFTPNAMAQASAARTDDQLGSSNFSFAVPILSAPGRGVGVDLTLIYNSRMWTKDGNSMTFDYDQGWPAPGFRLNYGRIILDYDVNSGSGNHLLIQPDGTRIPLLSQGGGKFRSFDGQHIEFDENTNKLTYTDGTLIRYAVSNNKLLPNTIEDINGNSITIEYVAGCASARRAGVPSCNCAPGGNCQSPPRQAIDRIRDTLGRYFTFYYYANGNLAEIRAPGYSNNVDRVIARFYYRTETVSYNFGSMQIRNAPPGGQIDALHRVFFPETGRGYVFDDFSSYGMYTRVSMNLGMSEAAEGTAVAYTKYTYHTSGQLSDAPKFDQRQEWWQGKTNANGDLDTSPSVYTYAKQDNGLTITDSISSAANNVRVEMISNDDPLSAQLGLLKSRKVVNASTNSVVHQEDFEYSDPSPSTGLQRTRVSTTTDGVAATETRVDSIYSQFGRLEEVIEYGFRNGGGFTKRRRTKYRYFDGGPSYTDKGLVHLVDQIETIDARLTDSLADDVVVSRTRYTYDNYSDPNWSLVTHGFLDNCSPPSCVPPPGYDTRLVTRASRGNITKVEFWSNTTNDPANPPADIDFRQRYDIFGNKVKAEVGCCSLKVFTFSQIMWWSEALSITDGGTSGPTLITGYDYDLNTSFLESVTDPNGLVTSFEPDRALRVGTVNYPKLSTDPNPNPKLETFFNDSNYPDLDGLVYQSRYTYVDKGAQKVQTSKQWMDGTGRALRSGSAAGLSPTNFDTVKTVYDGLGRMTKTTNPYSGNQNGDPTGLLYWTTYDYDSMSRVFKITLPDGNLIETAYNGAVTTVTDQVGRQRRSEEDGLGRLIKVTEMDGSKQLTWDTTYLYDMLDNLTLINQANQTRGFKYDALSRLLYERTPEQDATISDGAGGMWSAKYTYTEFNAINTREDARRVVTTYSYDTLNRLNQVGFNTTGTTAQPTATVTINYSDTAPKKGLIQSVTDGSGTESYDYDGLSRLQTKTRNMDGRAYQTSYQYNQLGQINRITYPSGRNIDVAYDTRGRVSGVGGYVQSIGYNQAQQVTTVGLGNGVSEGYGYSLDRQQLTTQTVSKGATSLMNVTYGYNADTTNGGGTRAGNSGQLVSMTATVNSQNRNQTFKYDQVGRLAEATGQGASGAWQRRYDYDRWGNRLRVWTFETGQVGGPQWCQKQFASYPQSGGAPATNRAAFVDNIAGCDAAVTSLMAYDAAGNLIDDNANAYLYDGESRVVRSTPQSTTNHTSYKYDAGNRRVKKETASGSLHYIWEGSQVIGEYNASTGTMIAEYVYLGGRLIARENAGGVRYYHQDRLSVRVMTNGSGSWAGTQSHEPFGEEVVESGEQSKQRFTSYERDAESGTDYAVNRQYSYATGRFMRPDPMGRSISGPQSLNRYAYVNNDPVNLIDPLGLRGEQWWRLWLGGFMLGGTGLTWDGSEVQRYQLPQVFRFWLSGGADILPSGSEEITRNRRGEYFYGEVRVSAINDFWRTLPLTYPEALRKAIDIALEALRSRATCVTLIGGPNERDPANFLINLLRNGRLRDSDENRIAVTRHEHPNHTITIGTLFYQEGIVQHGEWFPNVSQSSIQALVILHELGHATHSGVDKHRKDQEKHRAYDQAIYDRCLADYLPPNVAD